MTTTDERWRAVELAREFLYELSDRTKPIRVSEIREKARRILRHYPATYDVVEAKRRDRRP